MSENTATNFVLIDYENVQPKNLEVLEEHPFEIYVFVGSSQKSVSTEVAMKMLNLGSRARFIQISGNGPNALDFHIAFYIGCLSKEHPGCYFHIISKDTGFDPLIRHLKTKNIRVMREPTLNEIPLLRIRNTTDFDEQISVIVKNLKGRGQSRPRKIKTLKNTINSLFGGKLENDELSRLVDTLRGKNFITTNDQNVTYKLS